LGLGLLLDQGKTTFYFHFGGSPPMNDRPKRDKKVKNAPHEALSVQAQAGTDEGR
jgi:hypothetical protein